MQKSFRTSVAALAVGLVLASCGSTADTQADPVTIAPTETASSSTLLAEAGSDSVPAAAAADTDPASGGTAAIEPAATADPSQPAATDASVPAPAEAVLGGRALASELAAASDFDANVLPDLQVDDIRAQSKVNLRNVFPADRPVLLWLWAPH